MGCDGTFPQFVNIGPRLSRSAPVDFSGHLARSNQVARLVLRHDYREDFTGQALCPLSRDAGLLFSQGRYDLCSHPGVPRDCQQR